MSDKHFWDSNLWIYLFVKSQTEVDLNKQARLKKRLFDQSQIVVSAQVLNEVANVLMKKFDYSEGITKEYLLQILLISDCIQLSNETSFAALSIKSRYQLGWFDSLIVASALEADARYRYSEDMHHGLVIQDTLTIQNPFL